MPSPEPADAGDRLRRHLSALPFSTFRQDAECSPAEYLSSVLGVSASGRPWVHCANLGAWETGTTLLFDLPAEVGGGVAVTYDSHQGTRGWPSLTSAGARADRVIGWTVEVRAAATACDLALTLSQVVVGHPDEFLASGFSLNSRPAACMLAHVLHALTMQERATAEMLIGLRYSVPVVAKIAALVATADALVENLPRASEVEPVLSRAIESVSGVRMNGAQIESLRLSEALMGTQHARWEDKALELAAAAVVADRQQKTITAGRLYRPLTV